MDEVRKVSPWPNIVSMSRLGTVPILIVIFVCWGDEQIFPDSWFWWIVLGIFSIGMATDALDGYLARKLDSVTIFGRMMDPLIDKILIQSVLILLCVSSWTSSLVPYWAVILIICRETLITGLRGYAEVQQIDFSASKLGKGKTMSQTIAIVMILAGMAIHGVSMQEMLYSEICYWAMMIATTLTVISGIDYAIKLRSAMS
ncbi:MAG: CDP-diacylglycerol--glycerol-3-phosphate 3-phosphatidyltransferase [Candidatus Thermoplasmatota archaeon]|nr:CDP-diacylglycerol--glycerol-3-phosphate 3-phosphatidyltransferase [Candidatus Thermoplasmatota archaeon]